VTGPRAADDFATIRARMEELRFERAPRAADDFGAIRARMEELRRERAQARATHQKSSAGTELACQATRSGACERRRNASQVAFRFT